jgi:hypothetical protein
MTQSPAPARDEQTHERDGERLAELVARLCRLSVVEYAPGFSFDDWPQRVDRHQWFTSRAVVSLNGTALWRELDEDTRKLVSFWDAVAFFSANIHGEVGLMRGIASRLNAPGHEAVTPYLHHMLDEENKHSVYFTEFCRRYGGRVYPDRMLTLFDDPEESADFLFFARVYLFEDIVDGLNRVTAADESVHPVARWINANHHQEERRHLAFGRTMVRRLWAENQTGWSDAVTDHARAALTGFLTATWKSLYNPQVYADAGLPDPWRLAAEAYASPYASAQRIALSRRCINFLTRSGILTGPVPL